MKLGREGILARARCSVCGSQAAVDMRLYWDPGANALDGARVKGQGE